MNNIIWCGNRILNVIEFNYILDSVELTEKINEYNENYVDVIGIYLNNYKTIFITKK